MQTNILFTTMKSTYLALRDLLKKSPHTSFPVVDKPGLRWDIFSEYVKTVNCIVSLFLLVWMDFLICLITASVALATYLLTARLIVCCSF